MKRFFKVVLWSVGGGLLAAFVGVVAVALAGPKLHDQATAIRAENAAEAEAAQAAAAPAKAATTDVDKEAAGAACQVETDIESLRPLGTSLCRGGFMSKVEIILDGNSLSVLGDYNSAGQRLFQGNKKKVFKATSKFVDNVHASVPRFTHVGYQLFAPDGVTLLGNCAYTGQMGTRCRDYTGSTPTWVQ